MRVLHTMLLLHKVFFLKGEFGLCKFEFGNRFQILHMGARVVNQKSREIPETNPDTKSTKQISQNQNPETKFPKIEPF